MSHNKNKTNLYIKIISKISEKRSKITADSAHAFK